VGIAIIFAFCVCRVSRKRVKYLTSVVGIAAVQLLAIIFAFCVCRMSRYRVKYLSQWWASQAYNSSPSYSPSAFAG
jgi:membrane protein YqaA with SNARE-associated domain